MIWLSLGLMWLARLLFFGAYVFSIISAYQAGGLLLTFLVAIPAIGQLLWFGMLWSAVGFLNLYTILLLSAVACYGLAMLILQHIAEE